MSGGQNWYGRPPAWEPPPGQPGAPRPAAPPPYRPPSYQDRSAEAARRTAQRESAQKQMVVGGVILVLGAAVSIFGHTTSGALYGLVDLPALIGLGILIAGMLKLPRH